MYSKLATRVLAGVVLTVGLAMASRADTLPVLTNGLMFRADATGTNLNSGTGPFAGILAHGGWTTVLNVQNIPGNYSGVFFLTRQAAPAPTDFLTPLASPSMPLNVGSNTFYFYIDGDDTLGGSAGFGVNLYFNSAAASGPGISAFTPVGTGQTFVADSAALTGGYDMHMTPGSGSLNYISGGYKVTLTSYQVTAASGTSLVDLVNSTNVSPFTPPPHPDGIMDTYGQFTLTVTAVPEPSSLALLGIGLVVMMRRTRKASK